MKKLLGIVVVFGLALGLILTGCTQKVASSSQAIENSKTMQTVQQKVDYLVGQANAFYNSKDFQQTINIAQYVLSYLDKNSPDAQSLIEKAKAQLQALAQKKIDEAKQKLGSFGK